MAGMKIYSIFDKKTVVYGRPFYAHNNGHALRVVTDEVSNLDSQLYKHAGDFTLYELGEFDDNTGCIEAMPPRCVMEIAELKE